MREGIRDEYTGFSLKKEFVNKIREQMQSDPTFETVIDFIRAAVREKIERMKQVKQ